MNVPSLLMGVLSISELGMRLVGSEAIKLLEAPEGSAVYSARNGYEVIQGLAVKMGVRTPALSLLLPPLNSQMQEAGTGTTILLALIGSLIKTILREVDKGADLDSLLDALHESQDEVVQAINDLAIHVEQVESSEELRVLGEHTELEDLAKLDGLAILGGLSQGHLQALNLAMAASPQTVPGAYPSFRFRPLIGPPCSASGAAPGIIIEVSASLESLRPFRNGASFQKRKFLLEEAAMSDLSVAIVSSGLRSNNAISAMEEPILNLNSAEDLASVSEGENIHRKWLQHLKLFEVDCLILSGELPPLMQEELRGSRILALEKVSLSDCQSAARMLDLPMATAIDTIRAEHVGHVNLTPLASALEGKHRSSKVEELCSLPHTSLLLAPCEHHIQSRSAATHVSTVVVCAETELLLDVLKERIEGVYRRLANVTSSKQVLLGGGASLAVLGFSLKQESTKMAKSGPSALQYKSWALSVLSTAIMAVVENGACSRGFGPERTEAFLKQMEQKFDAQVCTPHAFKRWGHALRQCAEHRNPSAPFLSERSRVRLWDDSTGLKTALVRGIESVCLILRIGGVVTVTSK